MCTDTSSLHFSFTRHGRNHRGVTLIELIVFIVIVSIAVVGVMSALNVAVGHSADPQAQKQALAIAEALLEEVELQPFTFCDPEDDNASTASSPNDCAGNAAATAVETRAGAHGFDQVTDYAPMFTMVGVSDAAGTVISGAAALGAYTTTVTVAADAGLGVAGAPIAGTEVMHITVTVVGPGASVTLDGYRSRYAPRI